jgi:hypothetical protein
MEIARGQVSHYVSQFGVMFNARKSSANPSGRRQALSSTVGFPRVTFRTCFCSWRLELRPADAVADFVALGSYRWRFTTLGAGFGPAGCGEVSLGALATATAGSAAGVSRTSTISSLSASVNVSWEKISSAIVCSGEAAAIGGGVEVPALIATTPPAPLRQRTVSNTVLITDDLARSEYADQL